MYANAGDLQNGKLGREAEGGRLASFDRVPGSEFWFLKH